MRKGTQPGKGRINLTLSPDLIRSLRALAQHEHRSISQQVELVLREWLDRQPLPRKRPGGKRTA